MSRGFKISLVDHMPPPSKLGRSGDSGGDGYGSGDTSGDDSGDQDAALSAVGDFFALGKKGDTEGALQAFRDLMDLCR
jgi:hypothetical protein